jgi:hypothetical protein
MGDAAIGGDIEVLEELFGFGERYIGSACFAFLAGVTIVVP